MSICLCVLLLFVWVFIVGGEVVFVVVLFGVYCLFCLFVFILGLWLGLYYGGGGYHFTVSVELRLPFCKGGSSWFDWGWLVQ